MITCCRRDFRRPSEAALIVGRGGLTLAGVETRKAQGGVRGWEIKAQERGEEEENNTSEANEQQPYPRRQRQRHRVLARYGACSTTDSWITRRGHHRTIVS